jgi:L-fuculose-phosphate aldolase
MTGFDSRLRAAVVDYSHRLHQRGWVANHDGNVSVRVGGRVLCTPTAVSKAAVTTDQLVALESTGEPPRVAGGRGRPPGEINLHLAAYRVRPDVGAVIHAHPPTATGFAVAGVTLLEQPVLAEAVVSLGPTVPTVPFALPGAAAAAALAPFLQEHDAVLIAGNGVLTVGDSLEQAFLRMELVEHLARICLVAHTMGADPLLPAEALPPLLEARRKAGLGPEARAATSEPPRPKAPVPTGDDLSRVIREELQRALRQK